MSDAWAMNPGKASTAVGTATIEADDELFTITDHGLGVGDTVVVDTLTGGASGVLDEGQVYWVVDVSTNTFALSQHRNGAPVEFSSDGGADVYRFAPQFSAIELRRLDSGLLVNDSGDRFGAREGIHPASDPAISVSGTTWTVENVVGVVYPALTSTSGPYRFAHPTESGSLDPADGSNPRIDALDLQIQDNDEDASGQRRARVVYVAGTPASSPSAPAVTSNSLRLGTILVPSGGSPSPSVSTLAVFTVASGGVLPVRDDTELPTAGLYDGMQVFRQDTNELLARFGSAWRPPNKGWTPIGAGTGTGNFVVDLTDGGRFPAGTFDMIRMYFSGTMVSADQDLLLRVNEDGAAGLHQYGLAVRRFSDWALETDPPQHEDSTLWRIANWHTTDCSAEITILETGASSHLPFLCRGVRMSGASGSHRESLSSGRLTANRLLDRLEVRGNSSSIDWWAEGFRS